MSIASTSKTISVRIPKAVYDWLDDESRQHDQPLEELASVLLEEAMRMERFPGIFFVPGASSRRARLMGGMDVWEMIMIYEDHGRAGLLEAYDFPEYHIDCALAYYAAYKDEIDAELAENRQPPEYWMAKYPELNMQIHKI